MPAVKTVYDHIWENNLKTVGLVLLFPIVLFCFYKSPQQVIKRYVMIPFLKLDLKTREASINSQTQEIDIWKKM